MTLLQLEVLRLTANGYSINEIAEGMRLTRNMVKHHRSRTLDKLEARNMYHAVAIAVRQRIIS
ncbi:MAG TPA: LuxR C-terminal-related transcriptional regulator [Nitrososphaera sp.]|jgi:DNA-binding CsgD family transcriptional regulator